MSSNYAPAATGTAPVQYDPQVRAAILRMSNHIAWMFWLWIGIPLVLAVLAVALFVVSMTGSAVL